MLTKICSKCKQEKPLKEFSNRSDKPHLKKSWCNLCIAKNANRKYHEEKESPKVIASRRAAQARYREKHREEIRAKDREYRQNNAEKERARIRADKRALRDEMITAYGGRCSCCGESRREFITLEHTKGNGASERRVYGGDTLLRKLRREGWPKDGYSILCWNCNSARGVYGYCPHEKERT